MPKPKFNPDKIAERVRQRFSPQHRQIIRYAAHAKDGSVSAREALIDLDMTSATLASRITELRDLSQSLLTPTHLTVERKQLKHPHTGKKYTRYYFAND